MTPAGTSEICARNYVDASYTGDLLAAAGVPHRLGLGDLRAHDEYMAARRGWIEVLTVPSGKAGQARAAFERNPFVRIETALRPHDEVSRLGMPSLTFRLCVTRDEENRTPFERGYRYDTWLPSFRLLVAGTGPGVQRRTTGR